MPKISISTTVFPPDLRDLNYTKFFEEGETQISRSEDYNSHNTERLDVAGMIKLLNSLDYIRTVVAGRTPVNEG
ncbi:hypothetical protein ACVWXN_001571 [Bradyrhizobium sp. i1.4.4]